jgi:NADPH:quinone reductase
MGLRSLVAYLYHCRDELIFFLAANHAAGVTPLDHTILSGKFHTTKVPLVLGNEGAGVVEAGGGTDFPVGSRVMFWGTYGAFERGAYSEWVAVQKEDLCPIPDMSTM